MSLRKSLLGLMADALGLCRTRLALFSLEAANEQARLLKLLGMAFGALLFLTLAVLVLTVTVAVIVWPTQERYVALSLLAALYGLIGVGLWLALRRMLVHGDPPFSATLEELERDMTVLAQARDRAAASTQPRDEG